MNIVISPSRDPTFLSFSLLTVQIYAGEVSKPATVKPSSSDADIPKVMKATLPLHDSRNLKVDNINMVMVATAAKCWRLSKM